MLAVVVLAGLLPDTGVVSATSNCTYGNCPSSTPFPLWAVSAAVVVVLIALILALLLLRRNRRRPPSGSSTPEGTAAGAGTQGGQTWTEPQDSSQQGWDETHPASEPSAGSEDGEPQYDADSTGPAQ